MIFEVKNSGMRVAVTWNVVKMKHLFVCSMRVSCEAIFQPFNDVMKSSVDSLSWRSKFFVDDSVSKEATLIFHLLIRVLLDRGKVGRCANLSSGYRMFSIGPF